MKTQEFTLHQCIEHIARCAEHDMKVGKQNDIHVVYVV